MPKIQKINHSDKFSAHKSFGRSVGDTRDCSVIAIAIACDVTYEVAQKAMADAGRVKGRGAYNGQIHEALESLGFKVKRWTIARMFDKIRRIPRDKFLCSPEQGARRHRDSARQDRSRQRRARGKDGRSRRARA